MTPPRGMIGQAVGLGLVAAVLQVATLYLGVQDKPNKSATALLQCMTLLFGIYSSYVFGRLSATTAAKEIIRPHARASVRRVLNLYRALDRQRIAMDEYFNQLGSHVHQVEREKYVRLDAVRWAIGGLQGLVIEQLATAYDALEDWRDLVPEEVDRIREDEVARGESSQAPVNRTEAGDFNGTS